MDSSSGSVASTWRDRDALFLTICLDTVTVIFIKR
jgi:hypothetical protein